MQRKNLCSTQSFLLAREQLVGHPYPRTFTNHALAYRKNRPKLKERYHAHIHTSEQPRFCVKYRNKSEHSDTVYLNVLPLEKEEDIHFSHGKFVGIEEIRASYPSFSPNLQEEYEFLGMAAELWNDFYSEL